MSVLGFTDCSASRSGHLIPGEGAQGALRLGETKADLDLLAGRPTSNKKFYLLTWPGSFDMKSFYFCAKNVMLLMQLMVRQIRHNLYIV